MNMRFVGGWMLLCCFLVIPTLSATEIGITCTNSSSGAYASSTGPGSAVEGLVGYGEYPCTGTLAMSFETGEAISFNNDPLLPNASYSYTAFFGTGGTIGFPILTTADGLALVQTGGYLTSAVYTALATHWYPVFVSNFHGEFISTFVDETNRQYFGTGSLDWSCTVADTPICRGTNSWVMDLEPVPEPASFLLIGSGAIALAGALRKKLTTTDHS